MLRNIPRLSPQPCTHLYDGGGGWEGGGLLGGSLGEARCCRRKGEKK